jgi:type III restriction enzyme
MPYFCLRVPTGGSRWLAAKSVALINTHLLRTEHSVILWLTPSKPIRQQTLRALRDRNHPYAVALRETGLVTVLDLEEAKSVTRATMETSTVVIVATRQAFQVEDEESRKVYESSGALMHHFDNLSPVQREELLGDGDIVPYSLANVLRLRRPFVIVDEAHNSRTELAFDTLARFRPSGIMELTATPDTVKTPSNVLHSVSAAELKAEEMIKLPIVLETEPNWQQCLADAIARRDELHKLADEERRRGSSYLRPIVLIQSEPHRQGIDTLNVERVHQELIDNHRIPPQEIIIATGEEKGLEKIDKEYRNGIADESCPVKYVITQKALAEGWDCPFAYILVAWRLCIQPLLSSSYWAACCVSRKRGVARRMRLISHSPLSCRVILRRPQAHCATVLYRAQDLSGRKLPSSLQRQRPNKGAWIWKGIRGALSSGLLLWHFLKNQI